MNKTKNLLKEGKVALGAWVTIQHADVAEIMATLPFDWLLFDMEHSPADFSTINTLLPALNGTEITPFIRVPWNDMVMIKRALDLGIQGLLIPYVNTKEEAEAVVRASRYPPKGIRGVGPRRATKYGVIPITEYYEKFEKEDLLIGIQIETDEALKNIEDMLSVDGVDLAFIGPNDLSASLGVFRKLDDPKFQRAVDLVLEACESSGVAPGIMTGGSEDAKKWIERGFKFVSIAHDYSILRKAYLNALTEVSEFVKTLKR
jgi:2-keto-3-deoxy-L-rhamnonate aldolase RhmA